MPQETIKNLKKVDECVYPGCNNKDIVAVTMNVYDITESGGFIINNKLQTISSLCPYHSSLAEEGVLRLVNQEGMIRLWGAFDVIAICESVIKANGNKKNKKMSKM